jgi:hypothetical protein
VLNKLTDYGDTITLVPQSGIQFVEFGFDLAQADKFSRNFIERPIGEKLDGSGQTEYTLIPNWIDDDLKADPPHFPGSLDDEYTVSRDKALDVFLGQWVPVPFLRIDPGRDAYNRERFADGPVDWVRMRITETRKTYGDKEASHRVVFAFDTTVVEQRPNRPYLGISHADTQQGESFRFAHLLKDTAVFMSNRSTPQPGGPVVDSQSWLIDWLEVIFKNYKQRLRPNSARNLRPEDFPHTLEHVASYMTLIQFLAQTIEIARITLIDTVSEDPRVSPINVDLVLDIGNSRTCGLVIQNFPNDSSVDLNRSLVLELRDLAEPILSYREPFESHLELVHAEFGPEDLAKKSGRSRAFFWPSLVRLGPEAARYRSESEGTEAMTDLSSPKRYLWDVSPVSQTWRFRNVDNPEIQPLVQRSVYKYVNNRGDVLQQLEADRRTLKLRILPEDQECADLLRFSRSSFFTFMVLEIIAQALMMINSPGSRRRDREKDTPRRLRNIVLTIPTATPVQEQRIIRSRTEAAIKLLWSLMEWDKGTPGAPPMPGVNTSWDEASSVHLVYLYGEISQKLGGNIRTLFDLIGRKRLKTDRDGALIGQEAEQSLRVASVDIGGGTTDLMVTTYFQRNNRALEPVQNFREGFRRAGDDLLKFVIEHAVIPALETHLTASGVINARTLLKYRFADDSPGMSEADKYLRRQFVLRLLRPVALGVLKAAEDNAAADKPAYMVPFASFFAAGDPQMAPGGRIAAYLQDYAHQQGGANFRLADVPVSIDPAVVDNCVRAAFDSIFSNIAEAIYKLDVDVVLLTGRPSCLPSVVSLFSNQYSVPVDRIVPIRNYRVGNWYPFRQIGRSLIDDPKTTAVVGGMLCTLANNKLTNFTLYTSGLVMRSTARYIGEMLNDGRIENDSLYFSDMNLDDTMPAPSEKDIVFDAPVRIGYRQLARADWVASPLYRLQMRTGENAKTWRPPISVTIARKSLQIDEDASETAIMNSEATSEEFMIETAEDVNGNPVKRLMELKFDTSPFGSPDGLYWLDSGILKIV